MNKKEIIYKRIAILMAICYVLNLMQYQIAPVLHTISHIIEIPSGFISHESSSITEYDSHNHVHHETEDVKHEHQIIDVIDWVLEVSNDSNHSDETLLSEVKFEKHLFTYEYVKHIVFNVEVHPNFSSFSKKEKKGHPNKSKQPPQLA
ncbi:hypothetical protein JQC67_11675 [Aurantibacter crassamenti]|uniref:hypothetical protein n=1 Tax=Aurantibacter crassamenti TaxID=1837375 RepID=UPI001939D70C|nr:hypothetical protein [Aurantibacter crassamenti]MBM1106801.1 hypothetical protein [Aurantibacter crassamenti]